MHLSRYSFALKIFFIALLSALTVALTAHAFELSNEAPRWGETLRIELDEKLGTITTEGKPPQRVDQLLVFQLFEDGSRRSIRLPLRWQDGIGTVELELPTGLAFLNIYRVGAPMSTYSYPLRIRRPDGQLARGASEKAIAVWNSGPLQPHEEFAQELALYPDNLSVYRALWATQGGIQGEVPAELEQQLAELRSSEFAGSDEWLYAMSYGYLLLGDEPQSRQLLGQLMERHPRSILISQGLQDYLYSSLSRQLDEEGRQQIKAQAGAHLKRFPGLPEALGLLRYLGLEQVPLATVKAVHHAAVAADSASAETHLILAMAYRQHGAEPAAGLASALRAADLALAFRLDHDTPEGVLAYTVAQAAYLEAAQLAIAAELPARAVVYARAAREISGDHRGMMPDLPTYEVEAQAWQTLGHRDRVEDLYRQAWKQGSEQAEAQLARSYQDRTGSAEGFESYLQTLRKEPNATQGDCQAATLADLELRLPNGDLRRLRDLRGQLVVLNFWNIGCLPCRAEMPYLNRMVERFAGREVLFLAPTGDSAEDLERFFAKHEFDYQIVPDDGALRRAFDVDGIPVHVVIGRDGEILKRYDGGSEEVVGVLSRLIERSL